MPSKEKEFQGQKEFEQNLKNLSSVTTQGIVAALEKGANNLVNHAKGNHQFWRSLDSSTILQHPDERFYTRTSKLVNSIRIGETRVAPDGSSVEVEALAGDPSVVQYAVRVEMGDPQGRTRAFPFMKPGLEKTASENFKLIADAVRRENGG